MKITFELTEKQAEVLAALLALPQNQGKTPEEACKWMVVQSLIQVKKQMLEKELQA